MKLKQLQGGLMPCNSSSLLNRAENWLKVFIKSLNIHPFLSDMGLDFLGGFGQEKQEERKYERKLTH